jgi:endonuclease III-like uncharacterized protein
VAQVVEHLPSKYETLISTSSITKIKKKKIQQLLLSIGWIRKAKCKRTISKLVVHFSKLFTSLEGRKGLGC